jgi:hypothetical protein
MPAFVDDHAVPDFTDLVYPVGELVASILNMDTGVVVAEIASVYIGNPRHDVSLSN